MRHRNVLAACVAVVLLAACALGQFRKKNEDSNTRTVQGTVTSSSDSPLEGAVVQLKDTKSLQVRSFITKNDGNYHFNGLNPNVDYELKADYQSKSSGNKTLSSFDTRKIAVINFKIDAGN
jgi:hypothetical protein